VAGSCEYGNEPSGSVKGGVFLNCASEYQNTLLYGFKCICPI
jgi:hypothetical protein